MASYSVDLTIEDSFDVIGVPEHLRHDVKLFVAVDALLKTPDGKAAARAHSVLRFFESCFGNFDEKKVGHWAVRDYAMKIIERNKHPLINGTKKKVLSSKNKPPPKQK